VATNLFRQLRVSVAGKDLNAAGCAHRVSDK
jgi:hypothetical protein